MSTRALVAGVGNDLMRDDGFGIVAIRRLSTRGVPPGVRLIESGIAGIGLVQELLDPCDALVILDAAERGAQPGTLHLLAVDVPDPAELGSDERRDLMSDMHLAVPSRALILARALGVLPPRVFILGCQPGDTGLGMELTAAVAAAVDAAVDRVLALLEVLAAPSERRVPTLTSAAASPAATGGS